MCYTLVKRLFSISTILILKVLRRLEALAETWRELEGKVDPVIFSKVAALQEEQTEHAKEWRDMINTYFYRKSGIRDEHARKIY